MSTTCGASVCSTACIQYNIFIQIRLPHLWVWCVWRASFLTQGNLNPVSVRSDSDWYDIWVQICPGASVGYLFPLLCPFCLRRCHPHPPSTRPALRAEGRKEIHRYAAEQIRTQALVLGRLQRPTSTYLELQHKCTGCALVVHLRPG